MISIGAAVCKPRCGNHARTACPDPIYGVMEGVSMEWKDQYKHPSWQKKRLEALESAHFQCEDCASTEDQLHVHHKRYIKGRAIWDYDLDNFSVLCEKCHLVFHENKETLNKVLAAIPPYQMQAVVGLLAGWAGEYLTKALVIECYCQDYWSSDLGEIAWIWGCDFDIDTIEAFRSLNPDEAKEFAAKIREYKNG